VDYLPIELLIPVANRLPGLVAAPLPIHRENRAAQALIPPFRRMNSSSGKESGLYATVYLITRLHLLLVRLSALAGSFLPGAANPLQVLAQSF
jgi:hypothetical protein